MLIVKETIECGQCEGPMPKTLEGVVVEHEFTFLVKLPLIRTNFWGEKTDLWHFVESELTH